jgi:Ca2+-binding EF-hand superfamily protein
MSNEINLNEAIRHPHLEKSKLLNLIEKMTDKEVDLTIIPISREENGNIDCDILIRSVKKNES